MPTDGWGKRMEVFWFLLISLIGGLSGLLVYIYYLKKGQFDDPEEPKYQMFRYDSHEDKDAEIPQ